MTIKKNPKAFSLMEVSAVILIIGIFIISVLGAKNLIKKARISAAQTITRSSPISGTVNNKLWIETSLSETSFVGVLETGDLITKWLDNSFNKTSISISSVGTGPIYSNSINYIPAIKFDDNSNANYLQINNADFLNGTDYTIFIVEKRLAANSGVKNYLLGEEGSFAVGYENETSVIQTHSEIASADNQSNIEGISAYSDKPRVLAFTHSKTEGNKIYINATLANEDATANATTHLSGLTTLAIGKGYNGEIGEIAIFDRKLNKSEITAIEDYLTNKWKAPNNRTSIPICTSGTLLSDGCEASCVVSVNGSSTTSISLGASLQIPCDQTGYTGQTTETYTCAMGALTPSTPAASQCVDDNSSTNGGCAVGYAATSGTCVAAASCDPISITGSTTTSVSYGQTTPINCDVTGYTGTSTGYNCGAGGSFTAGTACACDTANGYVLEGGICVAAIACNPISITGSTTTSVSYGQTTPINCDVEGYTGESTGYSCRAGGSFTAGTACACDTANGYVLEGGICVEEERLLDQYPGASFALSLRKLDRDYSGSAIRVRRSSDNSEQDIGFTSGALDESALTTFVGAGNGFVVKFYDQSGNSNDAIQPTAANQPRIVTAGAIIKTNGKPIIDFGSNSNEWFLYFPNGLFNGATALAQFFVMQLNASASNGGIFATDSASSNGYQLIQSMNANQEGRLNMNGVSYNANTNDAYNMWNVGSQSLTSVIANSSSTQVYKNNAAVTMTSTAAMPALTSVSRYAIGKYYNASGILSGKIQEFVTYNTDQASNRTAISTNINDFYSIY